MGCRLNPKQGRDPLWRRCSGLRWPTAEALPFLEVQWRENVGRSTTAERSLRYRLRNHEFVSDVLADHLACSLGMHPVQIWSDWFTPDFPEEMIERADRESAA